MNALTQHEDRDDYLDRFALRDLMEHWIDRASIEKPDDPFQYLIDEAQNQRESGGGIVTCENHWCNMSMPASQLEAHRRLCNNTTSWIRCVRCNLRVEISKISVHRMLCRLERCALCGEMVLPRMMAMCPYRMLGEAERNKRAAAHRKERLRERGKDDVQNKALLPGEASLAPEAMPVFDQESQDADTRIRGLCRVPSLVHTTHDAIISLPSASSSAKDSRKTTVYKGGRVGSVSATPASGRRRSHSTSVSISVPQDSIAALDKDNVSLSSEAASSSTALRTNGEATVVTQPVTTQSKSGVPALTDPKDLVVHLGPSLLVTSQSHRGGGFGGGIATPMLKTPSAPAGAVRPSFPDFPAADSSPPGQFDSYPDALLPRLRSIQRLWRSNSSSHRLREEVLRAVWQRLENAQERASGKTAHGAALRALGQTLREQLSSSFTVAQFRQKHEGSTKEKDNGSSGVTDRGQSYGASLSASVVDSDLTAGEVLSASFEADPVLISDTVLKGGGYMRDCDLEALIRHCRARDAFPLSLVLKVVRSATKLLQRRSVVQHLSIPQRGTLIIVGDLHGQMKDLEYILGFRGLPTAERHYLFNGDFIDRGPYGCEVLTLIYSLLCTYPHYVHLNRGNHENYSTNTEYGFMSELYAKYGPCSTYLLDAIADSYEVMPLISIVEHRIAVVHGGAPRLDCTLEEIEAIGHVRDIPVGHQSTRAEQILTELLWNDPVDRFRSRRLGTDCQGPGWRSSSRGCGVEYLSSITEQFLNKNHLQFLIRSHDVKAAGFELAHKNRSITVFSASNYGGVSGNRGAVAVLKRGSTQPIFHTWFLREDYAQLQTEAQWAQEENYAGMALSSSNRHGTGLQTDAGDVGQGSDGSCPNAKGDAATPLKRQSSSLEGSFAVLSQLGRCISTANFIETFLMVGDEFVEAYYLKSEFVYLDDVESASDGGASNSPFSVFCETTSPAEQAVSADEDAAKPSVGPKILAHRKESLPDSSSSRLFMSGRGTRQRHSESMGLRSAAHNASVGEGGSRHALQSYPRKSLTTISHTNLSILQLITRISLGITQDLSITVQFQTIRQIREIIYFNRYALLAAFNQVDETRTGTVYKAEWCVLMRDVLKLDIPWYYLCQYLAPSLVVNGVPSVEYVRFLRHLDAQFALASRLSWQRATILRIGSGLDIPEDIVRIFCDQPASSVAGSTSMRNQGTDPHNSHSNRNYPAPHRGSLAHPTVPILLSPESTALTFTRTVATSLHSADSTPPNTAGLHRSESPALLTESTNSSAPSLDASVAPLGPLCSAPQGLGVVSNSTTSRVGEGLADKVVAERAPSSLTDGERDNWWQRVQINFNTFANKVRLLSPAAAFMEDNEVFALFFYFDVYLTGHVCVGDIVRRITALLEEEEEDGGSGGEEVLLVSGEIDFSTVLGSQHPVDQAVPHTMSPHNPSSPSAALAGSHDILSATQEPAAFSAPESKGANGGSSGCGRSMLERRFNNKSLKRLGKGSLSGNLDAAEGGISGPHDTGAFSLMSSSARVGDKSEPASRVCADATPALQEKVDTGRSEVVCDVSHEKASESHIIFPVDPTLTPCSSTRSPALGRDASLARTLKSTGSAPQVMLQSIDNNATTSSSLGGSAIGNAIDTECDKSMDTTSSQAFPQSRFNLRHRSSRASPSSMQQRVPSESSRRPATPPWIFSTLLRVQEHLFDSSLHLQNLFVSLDRSKKGRLTEEDFGSLIEFINYLLEHPLSSEQARTLFWFVHDTSINCVESMQVRHWGTCTMAHHRRGRVPVEAPGSTSAGSAWSSCETKAGPYARARMLAEERRGQTYILPIEFVTFFSVRPVPYEEEMVALRELLRTEKESSVGGAASLAALSRSFISALDDSEPSHSPPQHHLPQQQQQQQQHFNGSRGRASLVHTPVAPLWASRSAPTLGSDDIEFLLNSSSLVKTNVSAPAVALQMPASDRCGGEENDSLASVTLADSRERLAPNQTSAPRVPSSERDLQKKQQCAEGESLFVSGLTPVTVSDSVLHRPQGSGYTTANTSEEVMTESVGSALGASSNSQQPDQRLKDGGLSNNSPPVTGVAETQVSSLHPTNTSSGSLDDTGHGASPKTSARSTDVLAALVALGKVFGEGITLKELLHNLESVPSRSSTHAASVCEAPSSSHRASASLPHFTACHSCQEPPIFPAVDGLAAPTTLVSLVTPTPTTIAVHPQLPSMLTMNDSCLLPTSGLQAVWFTPNKVSPGPSNLSVLNVMPATRPYALNQPVEHRLTVTATQPNSSQQFSFAVPLAANPAVGASVVGDINTGINTAAVSTPPVGCTRPGVHSPNRISRGRHQIMGASPAEPSSDRELLSGSVSPRRQGAFSTRHKTGAVFCSSSSSSSCSDPSASRGVGSRGGGHRLDLHRRHVRSNDLASGRREGEGGDAVTLLLSMAQGGRKRVESGGLRARSAGKGRTCPRRTASPPQQADGDDAPFGEGVHMQKQIDSIMSSTHPSLDTSGFVAATIMKIALDAETAVRDEDAQGPSIKGISVPLESPCKQERASKKLGCAMATLHSPPSSSNTASASPLFRQTLPPQETPTTSERMRWRGKQRDSMSSAQESARGFSRAILGVMPTIASSSIPTPPPMYATPAMPKHTLASGSLYAIPAATDPFSSQRQRVVSESPCRGEAQSKDEIPISPRRRRASSTELNRVSTAAYDSGRGTSVRAPRSPSTGHSDVTTAGLASPDNPFASPKGNTGSLALDTTLHSPLESLCVLHSIARLPRPIPVGDMKCPRGSESQGYDVSSPRTLTVPSKPSDGPSPVAAPLSNQRTKRTSVSSANSHGPLSSHRSRTTDLAPIYALQKESGVYQRFLSSSAEAKVLSPHQRAASTATGATVASAVPTAKWTSGVSAREDKVESLASVAVVGVKSPTESSPSSAVAIRTPRPPVRSTQDRVRDSLEDVRAAKVAGEASASAVCTPMQTFLSPPLTAVPLSGTGKVQTPVRTHDRGTAKAPSSASLRTSQQDHPADV